MSNELFLIKIDFYYENVCVLNELLKITHQKSYLFSFNQIWICEFIKKIINILSYPIKNRVKI